MPDQPQVAVINNDGQGRQWDPIPGPGLAKVIMSMTAAGVVFFLFTWQYMRQGEVVKEIRDLLDRQDERRTKEQEREIARTDKIHEASETRLRESRCGRHAAAPTTKG